MSLRPNQSNVPLVGLAIVMVVMAALCAISISQQPSSSLGDWLLPFLSLGAFVLIGAIVAIAYLKARGAELGDEGVCSLELIWATGKAFPRLEKKLLKWSDISHWETRGTVIYLYSADRKVVLHTLLFKNPEEVTDLINIALKRK